MSQFAAQIYFCILALIFGAVVGSFLNVVIWRLPREEKLSYPGSHCPKCGHKILPWENIPVISWLFLRGRCSSCHLPISWRYPAGELATGILYFWVFLHILKLDLPLEITIGAFWLTGSVLAAAIIDAEHKFIPNKITYSGLLAALALAIFLPTGRYALAANSHATNIILEKCCDFAQKFCHLNLLASPNSIAITDCILGIAIAFLILGGFTLIGNWLLRPRGRHLTKFVKGTITRDGIEIPGIWSAKWEDIIKAPFHTMTVIAEITSGWKQVPPGTKGPLKITVDGLAINGKKIDWEYVKKIDFMTTGWSCPNQVMGFGDIKLMMMIGAFLGADATIYILFSGAVLGTIFGIFRLICAMAIKNQRTAANLPLEIPFGPFLAIPTILWLIAFA